MIEDDHDDVQLHVLYIIHILMVVFSQDGKKIVRTL
jgi:hypothetical protein